MPPLPNPPMPPHPSSLISGPSYEILLREHQDRLRHLEANPPTAHYEIKVHADGFPFAAGDSAFVFLVPLDIDLWVLTDAQAFISTVGSSGVTVQIRRIRDGVPDVDMLTTPITIDTGKYTSYASMTTRVINMNANTNQVLAHDLIAIDVDADGTTAQGLGVVLVFAPS